MTSDWIHGEGTSKRGKTILKVDMEEVFAMDPDRSETRTEYRCICPLCRDEKLRNGNPYYSKRKLYISKNLEIGYCHRCATIFVQYFEANPDELIRAHYPEFTLENSDTFDEISTIPMTYHDGMNFYYNAPELSTSAIDFLSKRRSNAVINNLSDLKFRAYNDEEFIIPFFWDSKPFFYQINYAHPKALKYRTPPCPHKPIYVLRPGSQILVLCEGIYDAIACLEIYPGCTIAALLGCSVTPYQVWMIRKLLPSHIIVYMDETILSQNIISQLRTYPIAEYCEFSCVKSNGEDPEEYLCRIHNKIIIK